jgi:hypothetical protein
MVVYSRRRLAFLFLLCWMVLAQHGSLADEQNPYELMDKYNIAYQQDGRIA